nr:outer membrane beta-barrel protein [Methylocapsa sp. RX1]
MKRVLADARPPTWRFALPEASKLHLQAPAASHKLKSKRHKRRLHKHHWTKSNATAAAKTLTPPRRNTERTDDAAFIYPFQGPYTGILFGSQSIRQPNKTILYGSLSPFPAYSRSIDNPAPGIWGFAGFNRQIKRLVIGFESDLGYANPSSPRGQAKSPYGTLIPINGGLGGSLRARLGVAISNRVMIYSAGGLSVAELTKYTPGGYYSTLYPGWTVGGGIEGFVNSTVLIRAEYLRSHFSGKGADTHTIRAGVGLKF